MDIAQRFPENPLITPADVSPSLPGLSVEGVLNPGVFRDAQGRTVLLLRVAERPAPQEHTVATLISDAGAPGGLRTVTYRKDDPDLRCEDARIFHYKDEPYLTTISHFRRAISRDGCQFEVETTPFLIGDGELEEFGIEDVRVVELESRWLLSYTAVSRSGVAVGLMETRDWERFHRHGVIFPPHNKDTAIFSEKVAGRYACLHRPVGSDGWGPYIWYAESEDLVHWGGHRCVARTRAGMWDEARVGAGAAPILTDRGWLEIYHGADFNHRYCLGALLLDRDEPWRVLARSRKPIMEPTAGYEQKGFFGNVIFTNGHLVDGDRLTIYYGASDTFVCGAMLSIAEVLESLTGAG